LPTEQSIVCVLLFHLTEIIALRTINKLSGATLPFPISQLSRLYTVVHMESRTYGSCHLIMTPMWHLCADGQQRVVLGLVKQ